MSNSLNRRDFLLAAGCGAMALAGASSLASGAEPAPVPADGPMFNLRQVSTSPVRIESIEILRVGKNHFVRSTSTDGATGICMANTQVEVLFPLLKQMIIPHFLKKDARDLETLIDGVWRQNYKYSGMPFWNCVGHVEFSLLDLLGHVAGKPVGQLLGRPIRSEIPIYVSSMRRDTTPEQEVEWVGRRLADTGAKAVKLKIGGRMSRNADASPGRTDRLIPLARKTFGDDVAIYVDANGSYDSAKGIEVGRMLEAHNVGFYEEPCEWEEHEATKRVADALTIPVAGGEQDTSLPRWCWMAANRGVDLLQPDLLYNGGILRCARVAAIAAAAGLPITPHNPKVGPQMAALLQFASFIPNLGPHQEWNGAPYKIESWYSPTFEIRNGKAAVPTTPGLGVTYDPAIWRNAERI